MEIEPRRKHGQALQDWFSHLSTPEESPAMVDIIFMKSETISVEDAVTQLQKFFILDREKALATLIKKASLHCSFVTNEVATMKLKQLNSSSLCKEDGCSFVIKTHEKE